MAEHCASATRMGESSAPLLRLRNVQKTYGSKGGMTSALRGVSLDGCGKYLPCVDASERAPEENRGKGCGPIWSSGNRGRAGQVSSRNVRRSAPARGHRPRRGGKPRPRSCRRADGRLGFSQFDRGARNAVFPESRPFGHHPHGHARRLGRVLRPSRAVRQGWRLVQRDPPWR